MVTKTERIPVIKMPGHEVGVKLSNDINKYALDFLHIFNNVKEHSGLIRVWNDYRNSVYVVCNEEMHEATREYLSQFGEVHYDRPVQIVRLPDYDSNFNPVKAWEYDMDKYDDIVVDPGIGVTD